MIWPSGKTITPPPHLPGQRRSTRPLDPTRSTNGLTESDFIFAVKPVLAVEIHDSARNIFMYGYEQRHSLREIDQYIERSTLSCAIWFLQALRDAAEAWAPKINVSANEGKLLYLLARIAGARRVLEIGLLGGYSTMWLAQ